VIPAISDLPALIATGRIAIEIVLLQLSSPDAARRYNAGLGIEHLDAANREMLREGATTGTSPTLSGQGDSAARKLVATPRGER
jgi:hypothetical protein